MSSLRSRLTRFLDYLPAAHHPPEGPQQLILDRRGCSLPEQRLPTIYRDPDQVIFPNLLVYETAKSNKVSILVRCSVAAERSCGLFQHDAAPVTVCLQAEQGDLGVLYLD